MTENFFFQNFMTGGALSPYQGLVMAALLVWSISWKGAALWHAAKNEEKIWFIAILLINLVGLVEIAYLFFFSKNKITAEQAVANIRQFFGNFPQKTSRKNNK